MNTARIWSDISIVILCFVFYISPAFSIATELTERKTNNSQELTTLLPIEQLITQTRKNNKSSIIQSARLTRQNNKEVYIIDFSDSSQSWIRWVYNAKTGDLLKQAPLNTPLPLEEALASIQKKYSKHTVIRSYLDYRNGDQVRIIELIDQKYQRQEVLLDAYTGQIISTQSYDIKPSGKEVSLREMLESVRENHKNMVVLRTRRTMKNSIKVREITYLDENGVRRKMLLNRQTGDIIEDKVSPWLQL